MVNASLAERKLKTFAALPVGANNRVLSLKLVSAFTKAPITEVLPVPA